MLSTLSIHPFQGDFANMDFHLAHSISLNTPPKAVRLLSRVQPCKPSGSSSSGLDPLCAAVLASLSACLLPLIPLCLDTHPIMSCLLLRLLLVSHSWQASCTEFRSNWASFALWPPSVCTTAWLSSQIVAVWTAHFLQISSAANKTPTTSASYVVWCVRAQLVPK